MYEGGTNDAVAEIFIQKKWQIGLHFVKQKHFWKYLWRFSF